MSLLKIFSKLLKPLFSKTLDWPMFDEEAPERVAKFAVDKGSTEVMPGAPETSEGHKGRRRGMEEDSSSGIMDEPSSPSKPKEPELEAKHPEEIPEDWSEQMDIKNYREKAKTEAGRQELRGKYLTNDRFSALEGSDEHKILQLGHFYDVPELWVNGKKVKRKKARKSGGVPTYWRKGKRAKIYFGDHVLTEKPSEEYQKPEEMSKMDVVSKTPEDRAFNWELYVENGVFLGGRSKKEQKKLQKEVRLDHLTNEPVNVNGKLAIYDSGKKAYYYVEDAEKAGDGWAKKWNGEWKDLRVKIYRKDKLELAEGAASLEEELEVEKVETTDEADVEPSSKTAETESESGEEALETKEELEITQENLDEIAKTESGRIRLRSYLEVEKGIDGSKLANLPGITLDNLYAGAPKKLWVDNAEVFYRDSTKFKNRPVYLDCDGKEVELDAGMTVRESSPSYSPRRLTIKKLEKMSKKKLNMITATNKGRESLRKVVLADDGEILLDDESPLRKSLNLRDLYRNKYLRVQMFRTSLFTAPEQYSMYYKDFPEGGSKKYCSYRNYDTGASNSIPDLSAVEYVWTKEQWSKVMGTA